MRCPIAAAGIVFAVLFSPAAKAEGKMPSITASAYAALCNVDDEIAQADRTKAEKAALDLAQNLTSGASEQVYAAISREAQSAIGLNDVIKIAGIVKLSGPFRNIHISHTYQINVKGCGEKLPPMVCFKTEDDPDRVTLSMRAVPEQFHVEVTVQGVNNDWSLFVWLIPEGDSLKALSFSFNMSAISGRTSRDLQRLAHDQNAKGHSLNAAFLYQAAGATASRGPNANPGWKQDLDKEMAAFVAPKDIAGKQWRVGDQIFYIQNAGVMGIANDLNLILDRRLESWSTDAAADADNRNFVNAIVKAYPELAESFKAIIARAQKPDGTGSFGTVFAFDKGFEEPKH
jgi:hypothetical protein